MRAGGKQGTRSILRTACISIGLVSTWSITHGQLVADGTTRILDGITTNISGIIVIGTNVPFTTLILTNGAKVSGDATYISSSTSQSNSVIVTGAGSTWTNVSQCYVGYAQPGNQLLILDGGIVSDGGNGEVSYFGGSNLVMVSGVGSLWANGGFIGTGKASLSEIVVTNGGAVTCASAYFYETTRGTVAGSGSLWKCVSLTMGAGTNRLLISDGGVVSNAGACLIGGGAKSDIVIAKDPGSSFVNSGTLTLGSGGAANRLIISNGAVVSASYTYIEDNAGSNNCLTITGSGSLLTNQNDFYLSKSGSSNLLFLLDGGRLVDNNGYVAFNAGSPAYNQAVIGGVDTVWSNRSSLFMGSSTPRNLMIVSNRATIYDTTGVIGASSGSYSNLAIVSGQGSAWTNFGMLAVGSNAPFNQLLITNGGAVASGTMYLGATVSSGSNQVVVADPGSILVATNSLTLGLSLSRGNQLVVSNGATAIAGGVNLGATSVSTTSNSLTVIGGNFFVTNGNLTGSMTIGDRAVVSLNGGSMAIDYLAFNSGSATFRFRSGLLQIREGSSQFVPFVVGDSNATATLELKNSGALHLDAGLVIASNSVLKGTGNVYGTVSVNAGGTLTPGASIGQITIRGNLVLKPGSTNIMELDASSGACDRLSCVSNVLYGGTLVLTNVAGALTNGSAFHLYDGGSYSGAFDCIVPNVPGAGLRWNTNALAVNGVLRVFGLQSPCPVIGAVRIFGNSLQIQAGGGIQYDHCYLLTTTNLLASSAWEYVSTNVFDGSGNVVFSPSISANEPLRYFRLQVE